MSRRYSHHNSRQHQEEGSSGGSNSRNLPKSQTNFLPKNQNPNPTLSNSLRQSLSKQSDAAAAPSMGSDGGGLSSSGRVQMGDDGKWVSSRAVGVSQGGGGNFVIYLPQDEAVAAGLGADEGGLDPVESQRVVDLLNRELSRLLKLSPKEFWREVASDISLHEFLDSFLKFRSRWYDFPHRGAKGIVAGVIVGEFELSRRVFMVLYRISSNKDPGGQPGNTLNLTDHAVLLQETKLLDLPKLLDICAIYGHENEDLTGMLVRNALEVQPWIHDDLTAIMSHFLGIVHTMHQRCASSLEVLFSSGSCEDPGSGLLRNDYLEVMDFVNDAIVSMDALINAYKPAAVFFSFPIEMSHGNEELLITLAKLHDSLLSSLQKGFHIILSGGDDGWLSNIAVSMKMLSTRVVKFGWKLLEICYLGNEVFEDCFTIPAVTKMFPAKVEDPVIRADILIQTFKEMSGVPVYTQENQIKDSFLQNLERNYHLMSRLQSLQNAGWISLDDEQLLFLSGIMRSSWKTTSKEPNIVSTPSKIFEVQVTEDSAILESKISQIKDLFPDYGKGFLTACLEVYNQNAEEVIQRILEGTLHPDLQCLDTSMEMVPKPNSVATVSRKDKGKGKLVEPELVPLTAPIHISKPVAFKQQTEVPPMSSTSSKVGRFVRKSGNMPDHYNLHDRDDKDVARTAALISQYEYEDEYDDSFDDLGFSVSDSILEESEMLNRGKSSGTETENSSPSSERKWGSRKKPQYYVKDGKNYSYKVEGSVAVANSSEAALITQAHSEMIHGLGRGGNLPLGAAKKLIESQEQQQQGNQVDEPEIEGRGSMRDSRGRGRRGRGGGGGGGGRHNMQQVHEEQEKQGEGSVVSEGTANVGNGRGRGRRGRGSDHYRKDRAMRKHFSGLSGV